MRNTNRKPNLTDLETKLLRNIVLNDYQPTNGSEPESYSELGGVWANCLDCGPEVVHVNGVAGVASSLSKKGLISCEGKGKDAVICLTEAGWAAYVEIRKARELMGSVAVR